MRVLASEHDGVVVVVPSGLLDVGTYPQLRDTLLQHSAEAPAAMVVDLADLEARHVSPLSVFPTVSMRLAVWPDIPLLLAAPGHALRAILARSAVTRFVPLHDTLGEALVAARATPERRRATWTLPLSSGSPGQARAWLGLQCARWHVIVTPAMTIIVSELITTVLRHTTSRAVTVRLELRGDGLSIAVQDDDGSPPPLPVARDAPAGGYGLNLVKVVARAWGHSPRPDGGKVIWAVAALDGGPTGPIGVPEQ